MFKENYHVHLVGIGGVGVGGLAELLHCDGYRVSGSDIKSSNLTEYLRGIGVQIYIGHAAENVPAGADVVVYSSAVHQNNPELVEARRRSLPVIQRAQMLGELMKRKFTIAVAGSHGKTTTTALIAFILARLGLSPSAMVGGRLVDSASGASAGSGKFFVAEADESDGSFCYFNPSLAVLTNIDREHLSFFGTFEKLKASFEQFLANMPFYGRVIACSDNPVVCEVVRASGRQCRYYGLSPDAPITARNIIFNINHSSYDLVVDGKHCLRVDLPLPGMQFVQNSLSLFALAEELSLPYVEVVKAIASFPGVARRSEVLLQTPELLVVDDYGHHPTEIKATIAAIKKGWVNDPAIGYAGGHNGGHTGGHDSGYTEGHTGGYKRLIVVFQPHRYTRTRELYDEFCESFGLSDLLVLSEIYSAGETPIAGVSGEHLSRGVKCASVKFLPELSEIVAWLRVNLLPGDVVLTLGAGDVRRVAVELAGGK